MTDQAFHWEKLYRNTPLQNVPQHFAGMRHSPFLLQYLTKILSLCPPGACTCETGIGSGYGAIWLSLRGVQAEGIDYSPGIVERAKQINNILGGRAHFSVRDMFEFYRDGAPRFTVVHHQGVLEHFTVPQIRAALAQQVALSDWVVFSVPSVHYPFDGEFGDERLLPLEEWKHILAPFQIEELRYYGDPQFGEKEHVLCVLHGQELSDGLLSLMSVPAQPYPEGISVIIHTRNEQRNIEACLRSAKGIASETIICDMQSEDATLEIARRVHPEVIIISHPYIPHFDRARNVSAMRARFRWVMYLDADERVPVGLGPALLQLLATEGENFEAVLLPFRHFFAGHWMQCLYPGYTAPRVLKNGRFVFRSRLHSGAQVEGRVIAFPADNPDLALVHYSYDSQSHYLEKLNRYTDGEAASMHQDGRPFHWTHAIRHFLEDFQGYYDRGQAGRDGVHGFLYSFLSAFYRFEQHAKLFELRERAGQLQPWEHQVPTDVRQILEFALQVLNAVPPPQPTTLGIEAGAEAAWVAWCGPLLDLSGYGEEIRQFLFAAIATGQRMGAQILPWNHDNVALATTEQQMLETALQCPVQPGFVQIVQNFPPRFVRHPEAWIVIGRTMFETDRLPADWVEACNRMDYLWVPSEFNRRTFADAGVASEKIVVIPGCFDPADYPLQAETTSLAEEIRSSGRFTFLSVFDWTRHKGWDVLLHGFVEAFAGREDVQLALKVWSTNGYSIEQIRQQAQQYVLEQTGHDIAADPRIRFVSDRLSRPDLLALYRACDAFVLPSRGEGWGRPYMEAMALNLPTIGTHWSGNTAFMNPENSYLIDCTLVDVPEHAWAELPTYRGHRWAEPSRAHLVQQMQRVVEYREEAAQIAARGREEVTTRFARSVVGPQILAEIARIRATPSDVKFRPLMYHPFSAMMCHRLSARVYHLTAENF